MSGMGVLGLDAANPGLQHNKVTHAHPYASTTSSASSSSSSVFSLDGVTNQSSISTASTNPADVIWENDGESTVTGRGLMPSSEASVRCLQGFSRESAKVTDAVAPELRKHPRRTNSYVSQSNGTSCPRAPPCLMRQSERKVNFVDNLVDTASQIVETIWPLSTVSLRSDPTSGCKNVLPLRTFIQETLRRSRTSYSTLQVALYYLIKIKPQVPNQDLTKDQSRDKPICRAMQCGRRMFLAALILASKYLQDRNYSARAWSKISGLNTAEINRNELMFLGAVDWRLHIPDATFQRWTDLVLRYTPGAGGPPAGDGQSWRTIIPKLSPELDHLEIDHELSSLSAFGVFDMSLPDSPPPPSMSAYDPSNLSFAHEPSPSTRPNPPSTLEAQSRVEYPNPPLPSMPRIPMLPTPQMTPHPSIASTPAASAGSRSVCRPSHMLTAMSEAQNACMARSTLDPRPPPMPCAKAGPVDVYPPAIRRSSLARSSSSVSSPDSMVSDTSSSSQLSQSSFTSSDGSQPRLAVKATLRCTNNSKKENRKPLTVASPIDEVSLAGMYSSPESYTAPVGPIPDFSNFSLETPVGLNSTHEAAQSLCELSGAVPRQQTASDPTGQRGCRKRGRTSSEDMLLQNHVRYLIDLSANAEGSVRPDSIQAKSFLIPESSRSQYTSTGGAVWQSRPCNPPAELSGPAGMKRACCGSEARKVALNPTVRAEYLN